MRRGIGTRLLEAVAALDAARAGEWLWLATYDHLAWNRPYYQDRGFESVDHAVCRPGMLRELEFQRRHLPAPSQRIAMRRRVVRQPPPALAT